MTALAHGGRGIARDDGYVVFVAGALPGDVVRAGAAKSKRNHAEASAVELLRPAPERIAGHLHPRGRALSRRPLAGAALRAAARAQARAGRRRAATDRQARRVRDGADRALGRALALPQQARVLLRRARGPARARLPPARQLAGRRRRRRLPPGLGGFERRPQRGPRVGARRRASPPRPRRAPRRAAQPRRPRLAAHRPGADAPGHLARLVHAPAGRPPHRDRGPGLRHLGADRRARRGVPARGAVRPALPGRPGAFLQTNTRDGRAPLCDRGGVRRADGLQSGSSTSSAGSGRSASPWRRGPARSGDWRSVGEAIADAERQRRGQRHRERALRRRRRPPRHPAADRAGRQAGRRRRRPAPRRASRRRSSAA